MYYFNEKPGHFVGFVSAFFYAKLARKIFFQFVCICHLNGEDVRYVVDQFRNILSVNLLAKVGAGQMLQQLGPLERRLLAQWTLQVLRRLVFLCQLRGCLVFLLLCKNNFRCGLFGGLLG